MVQRSARIEPYASDDTRPLDRLGGHERRAREHRAAVDDLHLAEPLPLPDRERDLDGQHHALEQWALDMDHAQGRLRRHEPDGVAAVGGAGGAVHALGIDRPDGAVSREAPGEQAREIAVAALARLAAEQGRVDRHAAAPRRRHLRPAGAVGVARLDADRAREGREQVVPREELPPGRRGGDELHRLPDERLVHRNARELRDVGGARVVARCVEAVRIREVRVHEPELTRSPGRRLIVDSPTEAVRRETVATSSSEACSSATIAVISFVIDAIGRCSCSPSAASTSPVPEFWTRYASASTGGGAAAAATARARVAANADRRASRFPPGGRVLYAG